MDSRIFIVLVLESEFNLSSLIIKILALQMIDSVTQLSTAYHLRRPASHGRKFCVVGIELVVTIVDYDSCILLATCYVLARNQRF